MAADEVEWLGHASAQAYTARTAGLEGVEPPPGFETVGAWTGVVRVFGRSTVEPFGVAFRSIEAPHRVILAFRGTSTLEDTLDDLGVRFASFVPYGASAPLPDVRVEAGFLGIYTRADAGTPSMQEQVFALLDRLVASDRPLAELFVTGHSLGAALGKLFTLDVSLGRPHLRPKNHDFGCPRVGDQGFVEAYEAQPAQRNDDTRGVRFQNTYDVVPCVPLEPRGFRHTSRSFLVAFHRQDSLRHPVDIHHARHNHALTNYIAVANAALATPAGFVVRDDWMIPGNDYALTSERPEVETPRHRLPAWKEVLHNFRLWIG